MQPPTLHLVPIVLHALHLAYSEGCSQLLGSCYKGLTELFWVHLGCSVRACHLLQQQEPKGSAGIASLSRSSLRYCAKSALHYLHEVQLQAKDASMHSSPKDESRTQHIYTGKNVRCLAADKYGAEHSKLHHKVCCGSQGVGQLAHP